VAETIEDFRAQWEGFSEGVLSDLASWRGVVVAGGAVHAALLPVLADDQRRLRDYYVETFPPTSDIDIFLYGMNAKEVGLPLLLLRAYFLIFSLTGGGDDHRHRSVYRKVNGATQDNCCPNEEQHNHIL
jgi:hypothetical protein